MLKTGQRTRQEITAELNAVITSCLAASGRAMPSLRDDQCPLKAIDGFDSLCGIEATVELQERLNVRLEDNIFVKTVSGRPNARTLAEVVEAIAKATGQETTNGKA